MQFFSISQKISYLYIPNIQMPIGESQYMRKEIIHRINQLGKEGKPFLFVIDYLGNQAFIEPQSVPFS